MLVQLAINYGYVYGCNCNILVHTVTQNVTHTQAATNTCNKAACVTFWCLTQPHKQTHALNVKEDSSGSQVIWQLLTLPSWYSC